MSLWNRLKSFWRWLRDGSGHGVDELARRLEWDPVALTAVQPLYREFTIHKRCGGRRRVSAPDDRLKDIQRKLLRRLFSRLRCHEAATGFQKGESIATHARQHTGQAVIVRLDLKDFFASTSESRIWLYFRRIGWNRPATRILTRLCTHQGGLPQGAPTSPRLSNLVNFRLDRRLSAMTRKLGLRYSRYADDITISFPTDSKKLIRYMIRFVRRVAWAEGYSVHRRKKLQIRRRHQQQMVTGLVVNDRVHLPRKTRRWLRAIDHHLRTGRPATLTAEQRLGWAAVQIMIAEQTMRPAANTAGRQEAE
jgi:retron-type reverse transcriptase